MSEHHVHNVDELKDELEHHDEWFRHAPGEITHDTHGDFNPYVVMAFLAVTIVIVFGVAFVIVPWFGRMVQSQRVEVRERSRLPMQEYIETRTKWDADLHGEPTWISESDGVIRIPIDMAMDQVVRRYAGQGQGN